MNTAAGIGVLQDLEARAVLLTVCRVRLKVWTPVSEVKDELNLPKIPRAFKATMPNASLLRAKPGQGGRPRRHGPLYVVGQNVGEWQVRYRIWENGQGARFRRLIHLA